MTSTLREFARIGVQFLLTGNAVAAALCVGIFSSNASHAVKLERVKKTYQARRLGHGNGLWGGRRVVAAFQSTLKMAKRQLDRFFVAVRDSNPKPHAHGTVTGRALIKRDAASCGNSEFAILFIAIN